MVNFRRRSTTTRGANFDAVTVEAVWRKGQTVPGYDSSSVRKDTCGAWMKRTEYGNTDSEYGWEIDHIIPASKGGTDALSNLQPLQWENNRFKSDNHPRWSCKVKAA
ncbi:HNH endonuclease signature motif containing protein [Ekhidna sp.]|uniref:HNH endonuclease signature motif containing protein n=1 Tax=Ekhidna sp. TaxID=2608089 RepID=UPI0032EDA8FB